MASSYYNISAAQDQQRHHHPGRAQQQKQKQPEPISITICGDGGCGKSSITLRLVRSQWTSEYDPTIEDNYSVTRRIDGVTYHLSLTDTAGQEEYRSMWAAANLGADAFLLVYDITSRQSLDALQYFNDLIDMESDTRLDNAERARKLLAATGSRSGSVSGPGSGTSTPKTGDLDKKKKKKKKEAEVGDDDDDDKTGGALGGGGLDEKPLPSTPLIAPDGSKIVPPVKIVAANKCDLQESRQVSAAVGLDWARKRGCGFMETSARLEVNVEETFALLVRRVTERRRLAAMGIMDNTEMNSRGMTKPLTPLPQQQQERQQQQQQQQQQQGRGRGMGTQDALAGEKRGGGLASFWARRGLDGEKMRRGVGGFWRWIRCW